MTDFEKQDGIAFILLYFTHRDEKYYIPYRDIKNLWREPTKTDVSISNTMK